MENEGIVIGKFYPPHKGHLHLIGTGLCGAKELTILVCDKEGQKIPGELRAKWLREMAPKARVLVIPDNLPEDDSAAWAKYTIEVLGGAPDVVFTSEDYGDAYARHMGCRHILVDKKRKAVPVSATKIRQNPLANWEFLPPPVRAHFAKRVCVLGAESTGTTTLARDLAEHFKTAWVPEFGRLYNEGKIKSGSDWQTEEFVFIARRQNEMEDELAKSCNKILICDTDSFATTLWHERYMGFISPEVDATSAGRNYDLYILTGDEIPFVKDEMRDGEHIRHAMHKRFEEELARRGKKFIIIRGSREKRLKDAAAKCEKIINEVEPV
jgi:NadR type nicotinamide-nucleotide adenylyltransferase